MPPNYNFVRDANHTLVRSSATLTTSSTAFDTILGGGLRTCAVTDVFGSAGTGKTQFAFQCALSVSGNQSKDGRKDSRVRCVAFVDCSGSFRPERIEEMAEARHMHEQMQSILESISVINVRSVQEQKEASQSLLSREEFSKCSLIVVDDVTRNFVSEYGTKEKEVISRQHELAMYARKLVYIALRKNVAVLLTNSARSSMDGGEKETTGNLISQFALFRIHFTRSNGKRAAEILQPLVKIPACGFEIESAGIVP